MVSRRAGPIPGVGRRGPVHMRRGPSQHGSWSLASVCGKSGPWLPGGPVTSSEPRGKASVPGECAAPLQEQLQVFRASWLQAHCLPPRKRRFRALGPLDSRRQASLRLSPEQRDCRFHRRSGAHLLLGLQVSGKRFYLSVQKLCHPQEPSPERT